MARLIRNLFIFFLLSLLAVLAVTVYSLENRLPEYQYNRFLMDLDGAQIESVEIVGNVVDVSLEAGQAYRVRAPESLALVNRLVQAGVTVRIGADYSRYIFEGSLLLFAVIVAVIIILSLQHRKTSEKDPGITSERLILPGTLLDSVRFDDVAGIPEAREELEEVVTFLKYPEKFQAIGASIPKGLLLQGPPGTGKTLLARAIAGEAGVPFYRFSGSDFVEMFVGVGASRVRDLFTEAKKNAPCIVFIDEIDGVGVARTAGASDGNDERGQTLNALLVEMDGFSSTDSILVLGATNRPDILDPALRRPGRFDRQITILPPDVRGRVAILKTHSKNVTLGDDCDLNNIAQMTSGFTGAELASLVNEAALLAARKGDENITRLHFDQARDRILLGVERKGMVLTEQDKKILAYHEAGHAIVAKMLPESDPIHKITIIPRGRALGQTQQLPLGERYAYSKRYLMNKIAMLLGGRAAEQMIFHESTTQAANDLVQATELATNMVYMWGMGDGLGPQAYATENTGFLGGAQQRMPMSNETASQLDQEVKQLLTSCYNQAAAILEREKYFLKVLSQILLQVETLDAEEFDIIYHCALSKKAQKYGPKPEETECAICPAKGHCLHSC